MKSKYLATLFTLTVLTCYKLVAQIPEDTTPFLIRFTEGKTSSYNIPMTKYCFVKEAGLKKQWPYGWTMKWDVVKKVNSNLLFMEMNSTDVEGWLGNGDLSGSVQLVFELPAFKDSMLLKNLSYKTKGLSVINNYGGAGNKKQYLDGNIKITKTGENIFVTTAINLVTRKPDTKQQFILSNNRVQTLSYTGFQELENKIDSTRKAETDLLVNTLTEAIITRDSIWEIENKRVEDSLKLHPYTGKFRCWISDVDKAGYSRKTYAITEDSLIIKEGPYDFIYLAKNYSKDAVYYAKSLSKDEKQLLLNIEKRIEQDSLKAAYNNFCIIDGLILSFSFESAKFSKDVTVSNYYNETIALVIGMVNSMLPKKQQLWYDKKVLLKQQSDCNQ